MIRTVVVASVLLVLGSGAHAQPKPQAPSLPPDLANLPDAIKNLKWQTIDMGAATPLERCHALLFLNHALDEIDSAATAQADLMSSYIQAQNMGAEFAGSVPPADPHPLTYSDSMKISLALLRGPLADSSYSNELANASDDQLAAYETMYQSTCQRRWSEMVEARQQIRCMSAFLKAKNKLQDFQVWSAVEVPRRQQEYQKEMAAKAAAAQAQQAAQQAAQAQHAQDERQAREKEQQLQAANQKMQQALYAAEYQQQQGGQQGQNNSAYDNSNDNWFPGWYGGEAWGAYGGAWCRDAAYRGAAAAQTEARMSNWHGASAVRGGRR